MHTTDELSYTEGVLPGKLKPPRLRRAIERPRLLELGAAREGERLVLISAGPGYGKTTLMSQLFDRRPEPRLWYQVDELDHDPAVFLRHLIVGICQAAGLACEAPMAMLEESTDALRDCGGIVAALCHELHERGLELTVCFDDFHHLDGFSFATDFVGRLIESPRVYRRLGCLGNSMISLLSCP
ncbi:MAG: hypothetical protein AB1760_17390 [Pseudomonadota bacterium]